MRSPPAIELPCHEPTLPDWSGLQQILRRDPGQRGVAALQAALAEEGASALQRAAEDLLRGDTVAILTGFPVRGPHGWTAETDGPAAAVRLAEVLSRAGKQVVLLTDAYGEPVLQAGLQWVRVAGAVLLRMPWEHDDPASPARQTDSAGNSVTQHWVREFLQRYAGRLTHLIAIERPGPSHTAQSLLEQRRRGTVPAEQFERECPPEYRNVAHNMRGQPIHAQAAKSHLLLDQIVHQRLPIATLGIGDGGNELGMGTIAWEAICAASPSPAAARFACRVATDNTLVAGTSHFGGLALAAAVAALAGERQFLRNWSAAREADLLQHLVACGGAVDGRTGRPQPTIDGLPPEVFSAACAEIVDCCRS